MASVSVSPSSAPPHPRVPRPSTMSSRRAPLASNPNAANSPLRPKQWNFGTSKDVQNFGRDSHQQPPAKKQALNNGGQRHLSYRDAHATDHRPRNGATYDSRLARERAAPSTTTTSHRHQTQSAAVGTGAGAGNLTMEEIDSLNQWKNHHRAKFPNFVFYFDKVSDQDRYRCTKLLTALGAREEKFFSIDITHVITTRPIPQETSREVESTTTSNQAELEQPQTINPSLLNRQRNMLFQNAGHKRSNNVVQEKVRPRSTDVLHRARDMGKKLWSLDKFQRVLNLLVEDDHKGSATGTSHRGASRTTEQPNLLKMLQNERVHGPSDRDPTVAAKELHYFAGPFFYIYDVSEKLKPIMVREYKKVSHKEDGDWPQFRSVAGGRCPFVEDNETPRVERRQKRLVEERPRDVPSQAKQVTGKRTLTEMEDGQNRGSAPPRAIFDPPKPVGTLKELRQNAFTSRAVPPRLLHGEPVASGLQASSLTSAIRSQMISSTTGTLGAKAGTSKEVQGLQRSVLHRHVPSQAASQTASQESSSRPAPESRRRGREQGTSSRSTSVSLSNRKKLDMIKEKPKSKLQVVAKPRKRDPKPGYCENCQDKFDDFEDHIDSRKHRRFAENDNNWSSLDSLLSQLKRPGKVEEDQYDYDEEM